MVTAWRRALGSQVSVLWVISKITRDPSPGGCCWWNGCDIRLCPDWLGVRCWLCSEDFWWFLSFASLKLGPPFEHSGPISFALSAGRFLTWKKSPLCCYIPFLPLLAEDPCHWTSASILIMSREECYFTQSVYFILLTPSLSCAVMVRSAS